MTKAKSKMDVLNGFVMCSPDQKTVIMMTKLMMIMTMMLMMIMTMMLMMIMAMTKRSMLNADVTVGGIGALSWELMLSLCTGNKQKKQCS